jgi:hypothetical protein
MELVHLHVFERHARAVGDGHAIAGARQGVAGNLEHPPVATRREQHGLAVEDVQVARAHVEGDDALADALVDQQVEALVLVEEVHVVLDALLVERLQDHVPRAVGGVAGAAHGRLAEVPRVAPEASLGDLALRRAVEGQAAVLQVVDRVDRLPRQDLRGVLVDDVVAALHGVEHMPFPVVFFQVPQRGTDAALGGPGVGPRGIELAQHGHVSLASQLGRRLLRDFDRGVQPSPAGADDDRVVAMVVLRGHQAASVAVVSIPARAPLPSNRPPRPPPGAPRILHPLAGAPGRLPARPA